MPFQVRRLAWLMKDIFRCARCACQLIMTPLTERFKAPKIMSIAELGKSVITGVNSTSGDIHHWKIPLLICKLNLHVVLDKRKPYSSFPVAPDMISNVNSLAILTSSICEPIDIVTSHWSIVLTLYLWWLSSSRWRCQPGRFSMEAHRHDRCWIYSCILLHFRGRIEIEHSYGLRCSGLCCHSRHSTNHSSEDRIVVNSYGLLALKASSLLSEMMPWLYIYAIIPVNGVAERGPGE